MFEALGGYILHYMMIVVVLLFSMIIAKGCKFSAGIFSRQTVGHPSIYIINKRKKFSQTLDR